MKYEMNLNPWISMWKNPRKTIREIVNIAPQRGLFLLAVIFGLQYLLNIAHTMSLGKSFSPAMLLIGALVLSWIVGFIWFYAFGACLYWTGKLFKGQSKFFQLRASVAWASVPYILNILMWIVFLATSTFTIFVEYSQGFTFFFISCVTLITAIWSLILLIQCVKEVQDFSYWRAIGNYIVALILYFFLLFLVGTLFTGVSYFFVGVL